MDGGSSWAFSEDHVRRTHSYVSPSPSSHPVDDDRRQRRQIGDARGRRERARIPRPVRLAAGALPRLHREHYNYKKQPPADHAENLSHYLRLAPALVPDDAAPCAFCIRHPDLSDSNIRVSKDSRGPAADPQRAGLVARRRPAPLPPRRRARRLQNEADDAVFSRSMRGEPAPALPGTL